MASEERPLHIVTPTIHSMPISKLTGYDVYLKLENLQIPGSFKIRGIGNLIKKVA
jgi:L-serine/L-threonine ammonia-lyase